MKNNKGYCRLCGNYTKLSFEHIPPRSAFNRDSKVLFTMSDLIGKRSHTKFRKGLGEYSLCESCNNLTGAWYGEAYVEWAKQGLLWLGLIGKNSQIEIPYHIKPLNVIKQSLIMMLAMSSESSLNFHEELRRFILNKEQQYLPWHYNVYVYLTDTSHLRYASEMTILDINTNAMDYIEAEIALPPFGYCVTSSENGSNPSVAQENGLYKIDWFSRFDYNRSTTVFLRIPKMEVNTPTPLDYR